MTVLEMCVDSVESAVAAQLGGADRIELCSGLIEGGLTPSLGLLRAVRARVEISLQVMIRPRAGDFVYSDDDLAIMRDDIQVAAAAGADGVVFGLLREDGTVDAARTRELVTLSRPMQVTFHRAIDTVFDMPGALEEVIGAGVDRVLTSGGEASAMAGTPMLRKLVEASAGRVEIMVGGGVRAENLATLDGATHPAAFHSGVRRVAYSALANRVRRVPLGDPSVEDEARRVVHADDVRALKAAVNVVNGMKLAAIR